MVTLELLLTVLSLTAVAGVTYWAYLRFRRSTADRLAALIGALAVSLGLLVAIPGMLHTAAVIGSAVAAERQYDVRFAWLITTGALLMYTGVINVWLATAMKRGDRSAMCISASATVALLLFLASLHPASDQTVLLLAHGAYLVLILWWLDRSDQDRPGEPVRKWLSVIPNR